MIEIWIYFGEIVQCILTRMSSLLCTGSDWIFTRVVAETSFQTLLTFFDGYMNMGDLHELWSWRILTVDAGREKKKTQS